MALLSVINIPAVKILACIGKHDSYTSLPAPSTDTHLSKKKVEAPPRTLKTTSVTSDDLWQIISLLVCLPVSHTLSNIDLFSRFFFLERLSAAASVDLSIQLQVKSYSHWSLPYMLFAQQANKFHCASRQIQQIDTFRAIIWLIFYRDTWFVLMEPCRNIKSSRW